MNFNKLLTASPKINLKPDELINDLTDLGTKRIIFTGGEPFLREDWPLFALKVNQFNIKPIFMTNGLVVDNNLLDIANLYPNIVFALSLDGADAKTHDYIRGIPGIFEHYCKTVQKLKAMNFQVVSQTTVMQSNINQLDDIAKLQAELDIDSWLIQIAEPNDRLPQKEILSERQFYQVAEKIVELKEKYSGKLPISEADCIGHYSSLQYGLSIHNWKGCQCGIHSCCIEANGNVKGCPAMNNSEGNIRQRPFKEIWQDHNSFKYSRLPDIDNLIGYCKECKYKYACRGGCPENPLTKCGNKYCLYKIEQMGYDKD